MKGNHTLFIRIVKILFFTSLLSSCARHEGFHDCSIMPSTPIINLDGKAISPSVSGLPLGEHIFIKAEGVIQCQF